MDDGQLDKCRQNLQSRIPLLGGWLHDQALKSLAADGSAEAMRVLEDAVVGGTTASLRQSALEILQTLAEEKNAPAQEALCRLVIHQDHPAARAIVTAAGYVPHDESHRALFYFLTDQWERYENLDFDRRLLREAYDASAAALRSRVAAKARQAGRVEWVDVVSGGKQGRRLAAMTEEEWRAAVTVLERGKRWLELWQLAQEAPPRRSAPILRRLRKARWHAPETDQAGFGELVRLALRWELDEYDSLLYEVCTLEGHAHEVHCLAFSPSGDLLASGSSDCTVRIWRVRDGRPLYTLGGHKGWVTCVAFRPDGRTLASAGRDDRVALWRTKSGKLRKRLKGHTQSVICLAMSSDSSLLASGSSDGTICLWKLAEGSLHKTLARHNGGITSLAFTPDSRMLASGSGDGSIRLWSMPNGRALQVLEGHYGFEIDGVLCLAISPDGELLASGGVDGTVRLWSLPGGQLLREIEGHMGQVSGLAITPDSSLLISAGADFSLQLWRLPSGKPVKTLEGHVGIDCLMELSPKGNVLATSSGGDMGFDHTVKVWALPEGRHVRTLGGHTRHVSCLAFGPDSCTFATAAGESIRLWSAELARLVDTPAGQATLEELEWAQAMAKEPNLSKPEKAAFAFIGALLRWRKRMDILVGEAAPRVIEVGAFDIELEG